ncbi:MAG: hypothetical protein Ct9H300mP4_10100 [Gammaproteobacteria bacterium]|nr:MAG: hypothetical protein Ct9H300mP4_10100 [Gammaproteobacteria bacterium]
MGLEVVLPDGSIFSDLKGLEKTIQDTILSNYLLALKGHLGL